MNYSLQDLTTAYRKAKVDAYYEKGHLTAELFIEYEKNLLENLKELARKLKSNDDEWFCSEDFTGTFTFIPKGIKKNETDDQDDEKNLDEQVYFSDPLQEYIAKKPELEYRLIGYRHSVNFHVLSSLWIDKIGYDLESKVTKSSFGCRLRRPKNNNKSQVVELSDLPSHFHKYIYDYKRWQSEAIDCLEGQLSKEKDVVMLTTDIKRFYHSITADFLLKTSFNKLVEAELDPLTKLLVKVYNAWSENILMADSLANSEYSKVISGKKHVGIPIGISASKVIANLFLIRFDNDIEQKVRPLYYGRYVDDIILILRNSSKIENSESFWKLIENAINCNQPTPSVSKIENGFAYSTSFPRGIPIKLEFPKAKERLFVLSGKSGLIYLDTIKSHMAEMTSEWRNLPDPKVDVEILFKSILGLSADSNEPVNGLRKADGVSLKRMQFSIMLRDIEALVEIDDSSITKAYVQKFFHFVLSNLSSPSDLFNYFSFYPRLFSVLVKSQDVNLSTRFLDMLSEILKRIADDSEPSEFLPFKKYLIKSIEEALFCALSPHEDKSNSFVIELQNRLKQPKDWQDIRFNQAKNMSEFFLYHVSS